MLGIAIQHPAKGIFCRGVIPTVVKIQANFENTAWLPAILILALIPGHSGILAGMTG